MSEPIIWYTPESVEPLVNEYFRTHVHSVAFWSRHLQEAFDKGRQIERNVLSQCAAEADGDDLLPVTEEWLHWGCGGNYQYDRDGEIEDTSFIGWETSRGCETGPSVALFVADWQLFLDGTAVPGVYLKTRRDVLLLLRALGIPTTTPQEGT